MKREKKNDPTAKQTIFRRVKNVNISERYKNEKCTCKACKTTDFHFQICKFVTFLLVLSWLFKLPVVLRGLHANVHADLLRYEVHRKNFFLAL